MPQVVPSMGYYSPLPNYMSSFAAESFDLSLLPDDSAVPGSPNELDLMLYLADSGAVSPPYSGGPLFEPAFKGGFKEEPLSPHSSGYSYADSICSSPGNSSAQRCPSPYSPAAEVCTTPKVEDTCANLRGLLQDPPQRTQDELTALLQAPLKRSAHDIFHQEGAARKRIKEEVPSFDDFYPIKEEMCPSEYKDKKSILDSLLEGTSKFKNNAASTSGADQQQFVGSPQPDLGCEVEQIAPVLSMAFEQLRNDVDNTCSVLGISTEPSKWTVEDVKAWLLWTLRQYALPMISMEYFNMDGSTFVNLTEEDFQQLAPPCGSTLFAQLEIWKAASAERTLSPQNQWTTSSQPSSVEESGDLSDGEISTSSPAPISSSGSGTGTSSRNGGSHIHLWQFLKELLSQPQMHSSCIRWLDRPQGVFKIEDSVRVARLWGRRKNRPAMNYDKLSRSIRQYYKKGIMKKTERSQRLVYQFCHPYCL
ncbi:DNA-binding protein D-ETS-4 [Neocloeon triangulifer]|uniref:DNA-binding protein D-ETS-4 n=1 Tax=Neocloeon triangulifer TaxID=2078957 RepID=UPI00286F89F4|nr:DNA-binding protein D-ETS-4 [Neocloeon triangulifer]